MGKHHFGEHTKHLGSATDADSSDFRLKDCSSKANITLKYIALFTDVQSFMQGSMFTIHSLTIDH
jgi:dimeric dUTPase (all-alpha-NTP-PPase superfamily)